MNHRCTDFWARSAADYSWGGSMGSVVSVREVLNEEVSFDSNLRFIRTHRDAA
jgi:hypothetical protein